MVKILVDTLGGDSSPHANIEGAIMALKENKDVHLILVGDEEVIKKGLEGAKVDLDRVSIIHAPDVIDCNDKPTEAMKLKKESSLYKCYELLRGEEDIGAMVSTGSTGAILVGAVLKLGRIKGVKRPAFCPVLPTMDGNIVGLTDSGANVDCDAELLRQFAVMGSLYMQKAYGVENPRVKLLNVGVEEEKGDLLRKETRALFKEEKRINFTGNMEARDFISGCCDLVVCDGFSGNVLLKSTEGACVEVMKLMKGAFYKSVKNKLGALLLKKDVLAIKNRMDYNNYGGAVLLGAKKTIVKAHGSSKAKSVCVSIQQAYNMEKNNLREAIALAMAQSEE